MMGNEDRKVRRLASEKESADTLAEAAPSGGSRAVAVDPGDGVLSDGDFAVRYDERALLGQGGMGEVRLCRDGRIGRDVAMKVIRGGQGSRSDLRLRFLREARVQGQLEHPAIVPVYDLRLDPNGDAYFTMKRIRGISLEEVLSGLREGDPVLSARFSRRRLLTAFQSVCLALDFAHGRGVLHRDLKPANIMLGDFGEVYLLDWGLAHIGDAADERNSGQMVLAQGEAKQTLDGQILGTPGYMAPEQVRGDLADLSPRADVYALGAILFEILTLSPLHDGERVEALVVATLHGVDARPSVRRPEAEVAPELEALCVRATALEPIDRCASAREVHDEDPDAAVPGHHRLRPRAYAVPVHWAHPRRAL